MVCVTPFRGLICAHGWVALMCESEPPLVVYFLPHYFSGIKLVTSVKCIFEETGSEIAITTDETLTSNVKLLSVVSAYLIGPPYTVTNVAQNSR